MAPDDCPNCGFRLQRLEEPALDCPQCGVVFQKWTGAPEKEEEKPRFGLWLPEEEKPPPAWRRPTLLLALLACVLWWWWSQPGPASSPQPTPSPPAAALTATDAPPSVAQIPGPTRAPLPKEVDRIRRELERSSRKATGQRPGMTADDLRAQPELEQWGETIASPAGASPSTNPATLQSPEPSKVPSLQDSSGPSGASLRSSSTRAQSSAGETSIRSPRKDRPVQLIGWYEGARGYERALREQERSRSAMVVYFHTPWCPWCARFDQEFLTDSSVRRWLNGVIRVHLNPEDGDAELEIARLFRVNGYPSFFVVPSQGTTHRVHPFSNSQAITPLEFIAELEDALSQAR